MPDKTPRFLIKIAKEAGYCYGVQRAVDMAFSAAEEKRPEPINTLGPIIHNPQVVEDLAFHSIRSISSIDEVEKGTVIIRSHGVAPHVIDTAKKKGLSILDATCPFVKKAQKRAAELAKEGYFVVILGERDHPEVLSILGHAGERALVVENNEDLKGLPKRARRLGVVVQTTQSIERLQGLVSSLLDFAPDVKVFNTICSATSRRQAEALKMTQDIDVMIIVGGKNSANTSRLAELCAETGVRTHHVETANEIEESWFEDGDIVGITTGASTPKWILKEVVDVLQGMA